jgi:hypothetical protein
LFYVDFVIFNGVGGGDEFGDNCIVDGGDGCFLEMRWNWW